MENIGINYELALKYLQELGEKNGIGKTTLPKLINHLLILEVLFNG